MCLFLWNYTINQNENGDESHRYNINRLKPRYSKCKKYDVAYMY